MNQSQHIFDKICKAHRLACPDRGADQSSQNQIPPSCPEQIVLYGSYPCLESDITLYTLTLEESCSQHQLSYCCRNTISASDFQLA